MFYSVYTNQLNKRNNTMTGYRTVLERVVEYGCKYKLNGTQLRTVYKILESLEVKRCY